MTPWRTGTMHPDQATPDGYTGTLYIGGRILQIRGWRKDASGVIEFEARDIGADDWLDQTFGGK
jgi:hypothetical protein